MKALRDGDRVQPYHYHGQPWLYHVTTKAVLAQIRASGCLRPSLGERTGVEQPAPRVYLTTQPDKWLSYFGRSAETVLLRVATDAVECFYDGGLWIYDGDEDEIIDERLADCFVRCGIPASVLEVFGRTWEPVV